MPDSHASQRLQLEYAPPPPQMTVIQVTCWLGRVGLFVFSVPCLLLAIIFADRLIFEFDTIPTRDRKIVLGQFFLILTTGLIAAAPLGKWLIRMAFRHP